MIKLVGASILALCIAAPAFAANDMQMMDIDSKAQKKAEWYMGKEDKNSDGMISKDEAMAFHTSMFGMADTNKDGKISKEEKVAALKKEMTEFKEMDNSTHENQMDKGAKKAGAM